MNQPIASKKNIYSIGIFIVSFLVVTLGATGLTDGSMPVARLAERVDIAQRRLDRIREVICGGPQEIDDCREVADIELSLNAIRGELPEASEWPVAKQTKSEAQNLENQLAAVQKDIASLNHYAE